MAAPQVEKVIVPWGWKRLLLNGAIVYFRWEVLFYVGTGILYFWEKFRTVSDFVVTP
jgi:hypothetical protein